MNFIVVILSRDPCWQQNSEDQVDLCSVNQGGAIDKERQVSSIFITFTSGSNILMSNNLQPTVIPFDVYELIIDSLAEDDEELTTMRACSLVSRAFLPLSRKHIFASVKIRSPRRSTSLSVDKFVHLIEQNPEIGEYIRKFDYGIATHDHIPHTLRKLTKLKSLTLWQSTENEFVWRTNWPMRSALLHLMQLPTLSHLKLNGITNFPFDLIYRSSLKHLEIECTNFVAEDVVPPSTTPLSRKSVCLREYSAGLRSASVTKKLVEAKRPDGLPIVDFTELTKVTASWDNQEDINVIRPIFIQAKQLKEIDLTSKLPPLPPKNIIDRSC